MTTPATTPDVRKRSLSSTLDRIRVRSKRMIDPLTDDDVHRQHSELMSPLVWDVGHVANFEEWWLVREVGGGQPHDVRLDHVYNPFDNPRWVRADLPILPRTEALDYMDNVRGEAQLVLDRARFDTGDELLRDGYVFEMIVQHEAQHQETMLQALDLRSDLAPYLPAAHPHRPDPRRAVDDEERIVIPGGRFVMGTDDRSAAYDNERPAHTVDVATFSIDKYPVTARRFAAFVADGGYERPELWTAAGRTWLESTDARAPGGWIPKLGGGWLVRRFGRIFDLDPAEIVEHVSFHEAEAFARWAGGRLPTEFEWEKAASWDPGTRTAHAYPWGDERPDTSRANLGHVGWGPSRAGGYPAGASAYGVEHLLGDTYEWTTSFFQPYPGYTTFPYPEYSEVFFGEDYRVLRGASWATSRSVARTTFRNWDYPIRRQIFSGIRVAWDIETESP